MRRTLDPAQKAQWDQRIGEQLLEWVAAGGYKTVAVYWALGGEPQLGDAYRALAARGVTLALPVVQQRDAALSFALWTPGEDMGRDVCGVAVPASLRWCARPPAIVVPCLGFNGAGLRLGYGGGYYDRTLAAPPRPATLGVAYRTFEVAFEGDVHDIALDAIATEDLTP